MNKKGWVLFKGKKSRKIVASVEADIKTGLSDLKKRINKKVNKIDSGNRIVYRLHETHSFNLPLPEGHLPIENNRFTYYIEEENQVMGPEKEGYWRSYKQKKNQKCCYIVAAMDTKHSIFSWLIIGKDGNFRKAESRLHEIDPSTCCY